MKDFKNQSFQTTQKTIRKIWLIFGAEKGLWKSEFCIAWKNIGGYYVAKETAFYEMKLSLSEVLHIVYGLCQRWWYTGPLFGLFKSTLPLYFTISDIVHGWLLRPLQYCYQIRLDRSLFEATFFNSFWSVWLQRIWQHCRQTTHYAKSKQVSKS